jgi:hypothetical protein
MQLPWRRKPRPELIEARRERVKAEQSLADAREHVIIPLRELREKNHVSEAINMLISQRVARDSGNG